MSGDIDNLNTLSDRLDYAFNVTRDKLDPNKKMTAKDVYKQLELSQSTFSAYRTGTSPSALVLSKLATPCNFNIHWLVTGSGAIYTHMASIESEMESLKALGRIKHVTKDSLTIDVNPSVIAPLEITDHLRFDNVIGNEFSSTVSNQDTVLVDTSLTAGEGIFLVEVDHQRMVRKVQYGNNNKVILACDRRPTDVFEASQVSVHGQVVWRAGKV